MKISKKKLYLIKEPSKTWDKFDTLTYSKCVHLLDTQSVKVSFTYSEMNARQLCMKIPPNRNKIKELSITAGL